MAVSTRPARLIDIISLLKYVIIMAYAYHD
jgi:hypothetical protein